MVKDLVEQLRYVGTDNEGLSRYCEALVIQSDVGERYVIHRYREEVSSWQESGLPKELSGVDEKIEFDSIEKLLKAFPVFPHHRLVNWRKTNKTCGFDISPEEFQKAHHKRLVRDKIITEVSN